MKKYIGMLIIAGLCGSATAAVVTTGTFTGSPSIGSSSDLFQNAIVTDGTSTNTQFDLFHIGDLFTKGSAIRQEDVVFADTNGTTSFVEFNVLGMSTLTTIDVVLQSDGLLGPTPFERALDNVRIYASDSSGTVLSNLVADIAVDPDYETAYGNTRVTLTINFPVAVTAQYFRAEFDQPAFMAPRVFEIDAWNEAALTVGVGAPAQGDAGDPSDDFQFAAVTANTPLHAASFPANDIRDLFTKGTPITSDAELIFADGDSISFVEFNSADAISLTNIVFYLTNDGASPFNRAVDNIKLYAGITPDGLLFNQVANISVDPDYIDVYGAQAISITLDLPTAVNAKYFRVEFGNHTVGARVIEIDGYGAPYTPPNVVDEPTIISLTEVSGMLKMVVDGPSSAEKYTVMAKSDLVIDASWIAVAHSDVVGNDLIVTNLSYSSAEGTNEVIYLQTTDTEKFFRIDGN